MAENFPGPYELRIVYTNPPLPHVQRLNVALTTDPSPGTPFNLIEAVPRIGSSVALDTKVDEWVDILRDQLHTSNTVNYVELWKYEPLTYNAQFISSYNVNLAGLAAPSPVPAGQMIFTFRTVEGGILKINLMEGLRAPGLEVLYPSLATTEQALVDYVLSPGNIFLARDTSQPFAFHKLLPGTNEALFKRRYR